MELVNASHLCYKTIERLVAAILHNVIIAYTAVISMKRAKQTKCTIIYIM
jgi:hypothetical protein